MYLETIKSPLDVKKLNIDQLRTLCSEIREKLIQTVSENGGHLASNLGVVELTVAMHYVFKCPEDSILFDVGHQCYTHKMLTGRLDDFSTIRKEDGLSGFMSPIESKYDAFISGHSSNAVSAACGIAKANTILGNSHYTLAVVGDGAMTGGMFFEGFNNSGNSKDRLILIINDNKMSISRNVGGLQSYLNNLRSSFDYVQKKQRVKQQLEKIPVAGKIAETVISKSKDFVKRVVYKNNWFESMGFYSFGPIDGNDIEQVIDTLKAAKQTNEPVVIHTCTVKGKGYELAEKKPNDYHGVGAFDIEQGYVASNDVFSGVFGKKLEQLAQTDKKICAVTAAMTEGTGLTKFREKYRKRFFDVGIAEQHAVTFCSGLSSKGLKPVFAVYSSFLQRGYDQIIHDTAIMNYNVTFAIDRAGIVGEDGVTHQGIFDVAYLNTIPNISVYSPSYYDELESMLKVCVDEDSTTAIRYPRGKEGYRPDWHTDILSDYVMHRTGSKKIAVTYGKEFSHVCAGLRDVDVDICKINRIKPLPEKMISDLLSYDQIVIFEEGIRNGGVGDVLAEQLLRSGYSGKFRNIAIDEFVAHSTVDSALKKYHLDCESVKRIMTEDVE